MSAILIFDSYGTLMEMDDFYGRLRQNFAHHGLHFPLDAIRRAAHKEMRHYMAGAWKATDMESWHSLRTECAAVLKSALQEQDHDVDLPDEVVGEVLFDAVVFKAFPGVKETLEELRARGFKLAVLSNWDFRLPLALEQTGLAHLFDFVLTSAEAGAEKPKAEIFLRGLELARQLLPGVAAKHCHYIGDHYEKDVLGSRAAGLSPVWLLTDSRDIASGETHEASDSVPRARSFPALLELFQAPLAAGAA